MDPATAVNTSAAISLLGFAAVIFLLLFLIAKWKWHVFFALLIPILLFGILPGIQQNNFIDAFESGFGNFNDAGKNAQVKNHDNAPNHGKTLRLIKKGESSRVQTKASTNAAEYLKLRITFEYISRDMEKDEYFELQYKSGASEWIVAETWTKGNNKDFMNAEWNVGQATIDTSDLDDKTDFYFRFRLFNEESGDKLFLDNIKFEGW